MPFLRLTRDRRGFENTFLMHADRPGERARLLYWYRTAPGIGLGRTPLDEDAIRAIEEQHPDIDFDWPAILALSEVMTPEEEEAPKPQKKEKRGRSDFARQNPREPRRDDRSARPVNESPDAVEPDVAVDSGEQDVDSPGGIETDAPEPPRVEFARPSGLVEQLAGREIAARLRSRYDEISARIRESDDPARESLLQRAEALDPDRWDTPEAVLQGVSNADALFEQLRKAITSA